MDQQTPSLTLYLRLSLLHFSKLSPPFQTICMEQK
jgi:hypothetical protein